MEEQGQGGSLQELPSLSRTARPRVCLKGRRSVSCSLWSTLVPGVRPSLLAATVGNSLSCLPQSLQQSVHTVLRVDANLLFGQVNVKLNSSQLVELLTDDSRATFTGQVHEN